MVDNLAVGCLSQHELTFILYEYVKPKTALNLNQVFRVGSWYFKDRFIYYKYGLIFVEYMYRKILVILSPSRARAMDSGMVLGGTFSS